jgi:hypothetical protein
LEQVNLQVFLNSIRKRPYRDLIQEYLKKQSTEQLLQAYKKTISLLPSQYQGLIEPFVDHMNYYVKERDYWNKNCREVFDIIINAAHYYHIGNIRSFSLEEYISSEDQEMLYNLFQIVTLNYAHAASQQPEMRKFLGIKKGLFRW